MFITDYERSEPLERFIFKFKRGSRNDGKKGSNGTTTSSEGKLIDQFATAVLQILVDVPHFSSRGSKFFLQFHLKDDDIGLANTKLECVEHIPISTVKSLILTKTFFDDCELEIAKEMNLEACSVKNLLYIYKIFSLMVILFFSLIYNLLVFPVPNSPLGLQLYWS